MKKATFTIFLAAAMMLLQGFAADESAIQVNPGGTLDADIETGGSVHIKGSDVNEIRVRWQTDGRDTDNIRIAVEKTGKGARITSTHSDGRRQGGHSLEIWVTTPKRFDLDVRTKGGNVEVADIEGKIAGQTMGGNITFMGITGELSFSTMGGNISLADSDVDGKVSTMGGNITVKNVAGNAHVSTMGGNVVLENVLERGGRSIDKAVEVSTMGGNITVANAPRGARVETKGGNIVIKKSAEFVDAKTMGGNITVNEHAGRVAASTMGGNVNAVIVPGGADQNVDINSMGGQIALTLPSEFSGIFDLEITFTRKGSQDVKIISDFPLQQQVSPDWERGQGDARKYIRATGTTGSGANRVKIRTVNGDIVIRKAVASRQ